MSDKKFALIVTGRKVKDMVQSGQEFLVEVEPEGWVAATSTRFDGSFTGRTKIFSSEDEAVNFAASWDGHPWWCKPTDKFRVIEIKQKYKQVPDGYEAI